jgi:pimeloyl-ACP methyl ester carboxylesterase
MALYVRECGPATAPTIVFLHGGGVSGWMWQPQMDALQADFHCLAPDLPEQGQSAAEKPFTLRGAAQAVAALIRERAAGGRAHVVGLSLGAQTVVQMLAGCPEVVDHAIVSSALARPFPRWFRALVRPSIALNKPLLKLDWLIRYQGRRAGIPPAYFSQLKADTTSSTLDSFVHVYQENMSFRPPASLAQVKAPVLIVVGGKELGLMKASARDLVRAIPGARGYQAPGLEHTWNLQVPELYTRMVRAWITGQPLPAELLPL